jgi:CDP-diacylglycerol--serine O-phosphatidyltransferase
VASDFGWSAGPSLAAVAWVVTVFAGATMVSNVPFYSFKDINFKKRVPFWVILALVVGLSVVSWHPSTILFLAALAFALSGYVLWAMGHRVKRVEH